MRNKKKLLPSLKLTFGSIFKSTNSIYAGNTVKCRIGGCLTCQFSLKRRTDSTTILVKSEQMILGWFWKNFCRIGQLWSQTKNTGFINCLNKIKLDMIRTLENIKRFCWSTLDMTSLVKSSWLFCKAREPKKLMQVYAERLKEDWKSFGIGNG